MILGRGQRDDVRAANEDFYTAFEARDLERMRDLWERSERAVCTHPGWGVLRGWERIETSFRALFESAEGLQFILTDVQVEVEGDVAWVTCDENLWGAGVSGTVAAMNVFIRDPMDGAWRMVAHHGSPVSRSAPDLEEDRP